MITELAVHWAPASPTSRGARRNVGLHLVLLVSLVASQLACRDVNRNQEKLEPNLALALLREDARSILALKDGRTAKLDLVVSEREWQSRQPFYEALERDGILRRIEDTTKFEESFGMVPARSFALTMAEDARDVTKLKGTLTLLRPAFTRVTRVDQQGKIARVKVEVTTVGTRTLQRLFAAARPIQKPAHIWSPYWWEHLPSPEATTCERTYILYNDQGRDAVTKGWGMFASSGLIEELFSVNSMFRETAARRLGELGETGAPGVPFLIERLTDRLGGQGGLVGNFGDLTVTWSEVVDVSGAARAALKKIGEPAVEPLLEALSIHSKVASSQQTDRDLTREVIGLLGELGDRRAIEPLANLMQTCPFCRNEACIALRKLHDPRSSGCPE